MRDRRNASRLEYGSLAKMPEWARLALHRGWMDGQQSPHEWPEFYDRLPESLQLLYEFGRLAVHNVIAAGLAVPPWDGSLEDAGLMHMAGVVSAERVGDPWPRKRDG